MIVPSDPAGDGGVPQTRGPAVDLGRVAKIHVALLVAAGGVAHTTQWVEPGSLLLGGAVMGVNFWLLKVIATALIPTEAGEPPGAGQGATAIAGVLLKFAVSLGLVVVLFWQLPIDGLGFAMGVTILLVALLVAALVG